MAKHPFFVRKFTDAAPEGHIEDGKRKRTKHRTRQDLNPWPLGYFPRHLLIPIGLNRCTRSPDSFLGFLITAKNFRHQKLFWNGGNTSETQQRQNIQFLRSFLKEARLWNVSAPTFVLSKCNLSNAAAVSVISRWKQRIKLLQKFIEGWQTRNFEPEGIVASGKLWRLWVLEGHNCLQNFLALWNKANYAKLVHFTILANLFTQAYQRSAIDEGFPNLDSYI